MMIINDKREYFYKISILLIITAITVGIHYGLLQIFFGHLDWVHAIHSRLCYIPIVIAASWFGLRGGIWMATIISVSILPYIFYYASAYINKSGELLEIIFYFAIAILAGALVDRESKIRRKQESTQLQLERAHKLSLIGQMAAGIAHEIKNPLASVKGAFEIFAHGDTTDEEKAEFQDIIFKEIKRIDGTVTGFLEFAKPREYELSKINLSEAVNRAYKQMQGQASNAGITITQKLENDIFIYADQEKIHQVLINLILNAIDATGDGGAISISLNNHKSTALIIIEDNGSGIEPIDLDKIFEPFYTTKAKGTGLGLAIIKSIIERHNGSIQVESAVGKGTKFIITIPLDKGK